MRCAVTGASGQLGRRCVAALTAAGHSVQRWTRRPRDVGDVRFSLGERVDPGDLRDVDAVIHAAHDYARRDEAGDRRVNVAGALRLFDACARAGVRRVVFVSSVAAFDGCRTVYGRGKREVERASAAASVRPGLLWSESPEGPYRALVRVAALPVVPLPDGGAQPLATAHADDVARALLRAVERFDALGSSPVTFAAPGRTTLRAFVGDVGAAVHGRRPRVVGFSSAAALAAAARIEPLTSRFGLTADPLRTLLWPDPVEHEPPPAALEVSFRRYATP